MRVELAGITVVAVVAVDTGVVAVDLVTTTKAVREVADLDISQVHL